MIRNNHRTNRRVGSLNSSINGQLILNQSHKTESHNLNKLLDAWTDVEQQFSDQLTRNDAKESTKRAGNLVMQLDEAKLATLEAEQYALLDQLAQAPASSLAEVIRKLTIWRSTTCPSAEDEAFLQPVDRLVLSVLDDLNRLNV